MRTWNAMNISPAKNLSGHHDTSQTGGGPGVAKTDSAEDEDREVELGAAGFPGEDAGSRPAARTIGSTTLRSQRWMTATETGVGWLGRTSGPEEMA